MKIATYNVNGVRAAIKKGLLQWIQATDPDVLCLQEIKADDSTFDFTAFEQLGYQAQIHPAQKKGYSGVATLLKNQTLHADKTQKGIGCEAFDAEGRVLQTYIKGVRLINAYFPSGTTGTERQDFKYKFLDYMYAYLQNLIEQGEKIILVGDYNICHRAIDIHNPVSNKNSSGFLPEERAWMEKLFTNGFTDTFRTLNPDPNNYTWWTYRANARARNIGWRIDYIAITDNLLPALNRSVILPQAIHSDHCPVLTELDF